MAMERLAKQTELRTLLIPIFIVLISIYPTVALYSSNLDQVYLTDIARSAWVSLAAAFVSYLSFLAIFRNRMKAAAGAGLALVLFFAYGHAYGIIKSAEVFGVVVGRHRYLGAAWLVIFVLGITLISRTDLKPGVAKALAALSVIMLIIPTTSILMRSSNINFARRGVPTVSGTRTDIFSEDELADLPDIYYIVPDSYLRNDVLLSEYGLANEEFTQFLRELGFFVADSSTSNYMWTHQSLASSLNMSYIHELIPEEKPGSLINADQHVRHSLLRTELEDLGYSTVAFATGWAGSELFDADIILTPNMLEAEKLAEQGYLNEFEGLLLFTTPVRILIDLDRASRTPAAKFIDARLNSRFQVQRETVLGVFENLALVPSLPGPKFIFAHIISPHAPYLFGPDGEELEQSGPFNLSVDAEIPSEVEKQLYRDQLIFVTKKLMDSISKIVELSDRPVVIILQSDHGFGVELDWDEVRWPDLHARMAILNAYYLSDTCQKDLYPSITPVNSFRHVLSCELGLDYALREDVVYIGYDSFIDLDGYLEEMGLTR